MLHTTAATKFGRARMVRNGTGAPSARAAGGTLVNSSRIAAITGSTVRQA